MTNTAQKNFNDNYDLQGMPLGNISQDVSLAADDTALVFAGKFTSTFRITSNDTTPANRTFTLPNGFREGQILNLSLVSGSSTTAQLATGSNVKLSATWEPLQYDTLQLMWDTALAAWLELGRSDNSP